MTPQRKGEIWQNVVGLLTRGTVVLTKTPEVFLLRGFCQEILCYIGIGYRH
eukprot:jgi/Botrbrau1/5802/Bobra.0155s0025.1